MSRPVVLADVNGLVTLLRPIRGCNLGDVDRLVTRAAVDHRTTATSVVVASRLLPDIEASAESSTEGWIVQRARKRGTR